MSRGIDGLESQPDGYLLRYLDIEKQFLVGLLAVTALIDEKARARKWGIEDLGKIYKLEELAKGDCIFAATGVTDGSLLKGVKRHKNGVLTTNSVVMRASSGTVRWVSGEHRIKR